jgi:hypothetical protein
MMKRYLSCLFLLVAGVAAAQNFYEDNPDDDEDVLTTHDNRGNISTVYNLFDGANHAIQITRLNAHGGIVWNYQHADGMREKAIAAAMDNEGSLYISGERRQYRHKYLLTMKYDENGYMLWEHADDIFDCTSTGVAVDRKGDVLVAGMCRNGSAFPVRILKYGADGSFHWSQEYDGGGRNYVRELQVDFDNNFKLTIESVYGNYRDGSYQTRFVTFNESGALIEVR